LSLFSLAWFSEYIVQKKISWRPVQAWLKTFSRVLNCQRRQSRPGYNRFVLSVCGFRLNRPTHCYREAFVEIDLSAVLPKTRWCVVIINSHPAGHPAVA